MGARFWMSALWDQMRSSTTAFAFIAIDYHKPFDPAAILTHAACHPSDQTAPMAWTTGARPPLHESVNSAVE